MTSDVVTVFPHTSIRYLAKLLADRHVSGVPVVDEAGHVVGIVGENDLLKWSETFGKKQEWWLHMLAEGFELAQEFADDIRSEHEKVRGVMSSDVVSVRKDTLAVEVAKLIVAKSIKRVPVIEDGKLLGIVSRADLVRAFARE